MTKAERQRVAEVARYLDTVLSDMRVLHRNQPTEAHKVWCAAAGKRVSNVQAALTALTA